MKTGYPIKELMLGHPFSPRLAHVGGIARQFLPENPISAREAWQISWPHPWEAAVPSCLWPLLKSAKQSRCGKTVMACLMRD